MTIIGRFETLAKDDMTIQQLMDRKDATDCQDFFCKMLDLDHLRDRPIKKLSGGELQRMAIALVCVGKACVGIFFENFRPKIEMIAKIRWLVYFLQQITQQQITQKTDAITVFVYFKAMSIRYSVRIQIF